MTDDAPLDRLIRNVLVASPTRDAVEALDIGIDFLLLKFLFGCA